MSAVVAMTTNRVIGDGTGLIWHLPDDLKRVKSLTTGCPLIMGRKTWQSIGRPLPGRGSIVLTRDQNWYAEGAIFVHDFEAAKVAAKEWIATHNPECKKIVLSKGFDIGIEATNYNLKLITDKDSLLKASMLRDFESGKKTECEHILGYLIDLAERNNIQCDLIKAAHTRIQVGL